MYQKSYQLGIQINETLTQR